MASTLKVDVIRGNSSDIQINDTSGNELIKVSATASAVNELTVTNAATGGIPVLSATGGDTNIGLQVSPKGTGKITITDGTDTTKKVNFDCSGVTTATTRTKTLQDNAGTIYESGGTDVAVADGGTGSSTAATARTALGLAIGTDVQAYDATLLSIATLGTAADKIAYTTGVDTWAETAITAAGRAILDDASAAAQATTLGLGTGNSPQFTGIELGHATDTTLARSVAGRVTIEGVGVVKGPASSTDNAVTRFDFTTGELVQDSGVIVDDSNNVTGIAALTASGALSGATVAGAMVATQAEQETGTATDKVVTPGRQKFHPSAAKAWAVWAIDGTIGNSFNVTSVTDTGAGDQTVNFTTAFSTVNYTVACSMSDFGNIGSNFPNNAGKAAGSIQILSRNQTGTLGDSHPNSVVCFGDQ